MAAPCGRCGLTFGKSILKQYSIPWYLSSLANVRSYHALPHLATSDNQCDKRLSPTSRPNLTLCRFSTNTDITRTQEETKEEEEQDVLYKMVELELKAADHAVLKSYAKFIATAASELGVRVGRMTIPKPHFDRITVMKSAFVHSKHRVQYEIRTHYRTMSFRHLTGSTASTFLEYIQRNLPEGCAMKVTKHELRKIPEHLVPPNSQPQITS